VIKLCHQAKDYTNRQSFLNLCRIPHGYIKILQKWTNSVAWLEILQSTENCGP